MTRARPTLLSLVAVLFALAVGVALGAGPLQEATSAAPASSRPAAGDSAAAGEPSGSGGPGTLEAALAYDDAYIEATTATLLDRRLQGRAVTVLSLPGSSAEDLARLVQAVSLAGGTVTARAELRPKLLDVGSRQLVEELAAQLQESARSALDAPRDLPGYQLAGRLLGAAVATRVDGGSRPDRASTRILASLDTAGLTDTGTDTDTGQASAVPAGVDRRGSLVLVLAGPVSGSAQEQGTGGVLGAVSEGLADRCDGVVVAEPMTPDDEPGLVAALRSEPAAGVSTVDAVDRPAGVVTAVRALAASAAGRTGHYGTAAAPDGPVPVHGGDPTRRTGEPARPVTEPTR